jgi:5-methylcytosine-specific restriction endonuclease McrA
VIEKICTVCHKRVKVGSMLRIYCQGHDTTAQQKRDADRATRELWIEKNPPDEWGYWDCYLRISPLCQARVNEQTMSIEHMTPKSRGTKYRHDLNNIKPACVFCNNQKGSRTVESLVRDFPHLKSIP